MTGAAIVVQARMGSTRLPGKALAAIGDRTLLAHLIARLTASALPVVLATTTRAEDDPLCAEARRAGIQVLRGAADDVLGRYAMVAMRLGLRWIIRATGDNPLVDLEAPRRTLQRLIDCDADHVVDAGLPVGATVEAVSALALHRADALAASAFDREHVTPFIRRDGGARTLDVLAAPPLRRPDLRFTVDTADDLGYVRRLHTEAGHAAAPLPLAAFVAAADRLAVEDRALVHREAR